MVSDEELGALVEPSRNGPESSTTDTNAARAMSTVIQNGIEAGEIFFMEDLADKLIGRLGPHNALTVLELMRSSMYDPVN